LETRTWASKPSHLLFLISLPSSCCCCFFPSPLFSKVILMRVCFSYVLVSSSFSPLKASDVSPCWSACADLGRPFVLFFVPVGHLRVIFFLPFSQPFLPLGFYKICWPTPGLIGPPPVILPPPRHAPRTVFPLVEICSPLFLPLLFPFLSYLVKVL